METSATPPATTVSTPDADKETAQKTDRTVIIINTITILIVLAALTWAIVTYFHLDKTVYTNDAQVESYINPINTRIAGYIKEIRFSEHKKVKKGDTLVIIDNREYQILVKQAQAVVQDAMAGKLVLNSAENVSRNGIDISASNIEEIRARLNNAEINYKRYASLLNDDVVTQFQFDQIKTDRDALQAKYNALQHIKVSAALSANESSKRLAVADAAIAKANASLEYTRLNLSYTVITAPYDGVVGRKFIEEGQFLQPGQTLVSIVRGNDKWVTANYTESQMYYLKVGQRVSIHIDAIHDKTFTGRIYSVSEATGSRYSAIPTDNSTGNFVKVQQRFPVKIIFSQENAAADIAILKTGMNAEVELTK